MATIELTRSSRIYSLLHSRWPQFVLRALTLAGFIFTILSGLWGSRVGSHNFAIIFVWIAWWSALKLFFIPLGGRTWCSICPIPLPGEWLQNKGILRSRGGQTRPGKRWPRFWRNTWLPVFGFVLVGWFGAVILTSPQVTAFVLLGLFLLATVLSLIYERRAFCRYVCPIGGFTGLYADWLANRTGYATFSVRYPYPKNMLRSLSLGAIPAGAQDQCQLRPMYGVPACVSP